MDSWGGGMKGLVGEGGVRGGVNNNNKTNTIHFINPSGKLKMSFDRTTKNISQ